MQVSHLNIKNLSALIFTEWIMAFTESETLARSQGFVGNWPVKECKKLTHVLTATNT